MKKRESRWQTREEWTWGRLEYKAPTRPGKAKYHRGRDKPVAGLKIASIDVFYDRIAREAETAKLILDGMRDNSTEWD